MPYETFDKEGASDKPQEGKKDDLSADLSRASWDDARGQAKGGTAAKDLAPLVIKDDHGHVTSVDNPDGSTFEYSKFDANGQPTVIRTTVRSTGYQQEWRREGNELWREHDPKTGSIFYKVLKGNYVVGKEGQLYQSGSEDYMAMPGEKKGPYGAYKAPDQVAAAPEKSAPAAGGTAAKDLAPLVIKDDHGHVTSVDNPDGSTFEYSKFDANGQPTVIRTTVRSTGYQQEWRREGNELWREHDPKTGSTFYKVLKGNYVVGKEGQLYQSGSEDYMAMPGEKKGPYGAYKAPDQIAAAPEMPAAPAAPPEKSIPAARGNAAKDLAPLVLKDDHGHVTSVDNPDGSTFEYSKFDANGQPTVIRTTVRSTGYQQEWRREGNELWREYDPSSGQPFYKVLKGNYVVGKEGQLYQGGGEDYMALPGEKRGPYGAYQAPDQPARGSAARDLTPLVIKDNQGRVTSVDNPDGSTYEYSKFDASGQPAVIKIIDQKTGDWGQWRKEGDNLWRAYQKNKPTHEVLRGSCMVDSEGIMHMDGVRDSLAPPRKKS